MSDRPTVNVGATEGARAWRARRREQVARRFGIGLAGTLALAGAWYLASDVLRLLPPLFLPPPTDVAERLVQFWTQPYQGQTFAGHIAASLWIVLLGWTLGGLIGVPLGVAMAWWPKVDRAIHPVFSLIRPIPPIAWIPLAILWFGLGTGARVWVVLIAATVPWLLSAYEAVKSVDRSLPRAARTLGASSPRALVDVVLPASVPVLVTGARGALGNAWITVVAAELLGATAGLGFVVLNARATMDSDIMVAAMLLIGMVGAALSGGLRLVERRLTRWNEVAR